MLTRILYFIFLILLIRFIVRLVREVLRSGSKEPRTPPRGDDPTRGRRVIDVDYEEVQPGDKPKENTR